MGAARTYNENLSGDPVHDPFVSDSGYVLPTNYTSVLNVNHDGVMGYLSINRISLNYSSTTAPPKTCSLKVWGI